jgi:hypothetical protein
LKCALGVVRPHLGIDGRQPPTLGRGSQQMQAQKDLQG